MCKYLSFFRCFVLFFHALTQAADPTTATCTAVDLTEFYLTAGQESTLESDLGAVDGEWRRILNVTFNIGSRLYLHFFNSKNIPINGIHSRFQLKWTLVRARYQHFYSFSHKSWLQGMNINYQRLKILSKETQKCYALKTLCDLVNLLGSSPGTVLNLQCRAIG